MRTLVLALVFTLGCVGSRGQNNSPSAYAGIPADRIDSLMNVAGNMNLFSGNILIAHDVKIAYERSFGKADYEKNVPNTPETKFQLASVTKDFTRVMVLQLAERKKLSLKDNLGKYLDGFSAEANKVTLEQLLDFTSGFGDYHNTAEFQQYQGTTMVVKDILPIIRKERLLFEPGTRFRYSNSGYVLLGAIIERVTGKTYLEALHELILDPLNLKSTSMNGYAEPMPGIATGYLTNELGSLRNNSEWQVAGGGDGGIYSTTHDLLAFFSSVFYDNRLLADSSKLIYATSANNREHFKSWDEFRATGRYSPAGGAPGMSSLVAINMKSSNMFIILSNYDQGTAEEIGRRIGAILNNRPVAPLQEPAQKYLYGIIESKGGKYFEDNYKTEIQKSGMQPDDDMVLWSVGKKLMEDNDIEKAVSLYRVYTLEFPGIIVAWNGLGEAYLATGDQRDAGDCFRKALELSPGNQRATEGLKKTE